MVGVWHDYHVPHKCVGIKLYIISYYWCLIIACDHNVKKCIYTCHNLVWHPQITHVLRFTRYWSHSVLDSDTTSELTYLGLDNVSVTEKSTQPQYVQRPLLIISTYQDICLVWCHWHRSTFFCVFSLSPHRSHTIYPADVVLIEGILVFYFPEVRELFHMKLFVDTDSDTRLARRGELLSYEPFFISY